MPQPQDAAPTSEPDSWSGLAALYERPAVAMAEPLPAEPEPEPEPAPERDEPFAEALLRLTATLDDERTLRMAAEEQVRLGIAEIARMTAELDTERSRIAQIERDRDDVLQRAEQLLNGMREHAEQRVATELEAANRHWSDLLAEERRRVERLDEERTTILKRLVRAAPAAPAPPARRSRRPKPAPADDAVAPAPASVPDPTPDPAPAEAAAPDAATTELAAEMEDLRQRLRARLRRAPEIDDVDDGVDALRESRLAREKDGRRRR